MGVLSLSCVALLVISSVAAMDVSSLNGQLLLGDAKSIRAYDTNGNQVSVVVKKPALSMAVDCANKQLFWSDWFTHDVYVQGDSPRPIPLPAGIAKNQWIPKSIALDSVSHNLYISNDYDPSVYVLEKSTGQLRKLPLTVSSNPGPVMWEIAVDGQSNYLFLQTDHAITRTNLNGEHPVVIYSKGQKALTLTKFTVDMDKRRVYALDYESGKIWSVDYNGSDKVVHSKQDFKDDTHLYDTIAVLDEFLYWVQFKKNTLTKMNLVRKVADQTFSLGSQTANVIKAVKC